MDVLAPFAAARHPSNPKARHSSTAVPQPYPGLYTVAAMRPTIHSRVGEWCQRRTSSPLAVCSVNVCSPHARRQQIHGDIIEMTRRRACAAPVTGHFGY
jgi:hypothetical protein